MPDPSPQTPLSEMLRLAADGDASSWERLVGVYSRRVYGLLVRRCGDRDLAEELTQATFVKVVMNLNSFAGYEERGRFEAWLFRIAVNQLRDEMRRRKRQAASMDMTPGAGAGAGQGGDGQEASQWAAAERRIVMGGPARSPEPAELLSQEERHEQLRQAVAGLSEADQEVLYLRHTAGLSFAQIAESLGQPLGTVLAREHRALAKLKKKLEQADTETAS